MDSIFCPPDNLRSRSVLVDLDLFPEIKNQGLIPMCASVAVADLFAFYYARLFKKQCTVDCLGLHNQICVESRVPSSSRLDGALSLWKKGLINAKDADRGDVSGMLKLRAISKIESTDPLFGATVREKIDSGSPVVLDMPLMMSAIGALSTGKFPAPYSIEGDRRISRHVVLIVGYRVAVEDSGGIWIIRNCWGKEWGVGGMGSLPADLPCSREVLKATIVEVSA